MTAVAPTASSAGAPTNAAADAVKVLIVEDHAILTQSLVLALRVDGLQPHVASELDRDSVLREAEQLAPDVVLLDLWLGDGQTSISMIKVFVKLGARVVVLTGTSDEALHGAALDAGAEGIVHKGESLEHLSEIIRSVALGHAVMRPARRDELLARARSQQEVTQRLASLTPKERAVLLALVDGQSAETIAERHYVAIGTVRSQIRSILRKLGVSSQLAAVAVAHQANWPESSIL